MTIVTIDPAIGLTKSDTHDPFPPIEFGRRDELISEDSGLTGNWTNSLNTTDDTFGFAENIQNTCNAVDGNDSTFASAVNDNNTIHFMNADMSTLFNATSSVEVKIAPNHYLAAPDPSNFDAIIETQANASGIATLNVSGDIWQVRIADEPFETANPDGSTQIQLYYIKTDGQYLIDPSCI